MILVPLNGPAQPWKVRAGGEVLGDRQCSVIHMSQDVLQFRITSCGYVRVTELFALRCGNFCWRFGAGAGVTLGRSAGHSWASTNTYLVPACRVHISKS